MGLLLCRHAEVIGRTWIPNSNFWNIIGQSKIIHVPCACVCMWEGGGLKGVGNGFGRY